MSTERTFNEAAFFEAIEDWRTVKFDRIKANCCHFTADVVKRSTGFEYAIPHTENPEDVTKYLETQGAKNLYQHIRKLLGKPLPPLHAHIGFVVYRSSRSEGFVPGEATIGVADRGKAWFLGPRGLRECKLSKCTRAFKTY